MLSMFFSLSFGCRIHSFSPVLSHNALSPHSTNCLSNLSVKTMCTNPKEISIELQRYT
uniref:Uncharacterized protein n=1 Tax=Anguilla anguilla TaxID=7936 RepID=A0A0E9TAP2_ANGAN